MLSQSTRSRKIVSTMKRKNNASNGSVTTPCSSKGKKVKRSNSAETDPSPEVKVEDDKKPQIKPAQAARVTVDEICPIGTSSNVFVEEDGNIYDASLNLSNIDGNNNKFYYLQLLLCPGEQPDYAVWTRWGRVGERGQNKLEQGLALEAAKKLFHKKFKDKTGLTWENRASPAKPNKYALIEKSYEEETDDAADNVATLPNERTLTPDLPDCKLSLALQDLVSFLFNADIMRNAMASQNYNFNKLPLGKLSQGTLEKGYLALKELGDVLLDPKAATKKYNQPPTAIYHDLSSRYYTVIPHDFGRKRPTVISNEAQLRAEMDLVETLGNMQISNQVMKGTESPKDQDGTATHPYDARMRSLALDEAVPVERTSAEFRQLEGYLRHSDSGDDVQSDASIQHIYRISRSEETDRFIAGGYDAKGMMENTNVDDERRLLWHGSRSCNFGGILSQGLRIAPPEAPANGKAFGNGVYLADRASKSADYCDPWTSDQVGLLLLCETQLGNPSYVKAGHEYNARVSMRKQRLISTKMMTDASNEPPRWIDAGIVNPQLETALVPDHTAKFPDAHGFPNEYIVYDVAQVKIRYVFMLKWKRSEQWGIY